MEGFLDALRTGDDVQARLVLDQQSLSKKPKNMASPWHPRVVAPLNLGLEKQTTSEEKADWPMLPVGGRIWKTASGTRLNPFTDENGNGRHDRAESFTDENGNGRHDRAESFTDENGNGRHDRAEPFTDLNDNGRHDRAEPFTDLNDNGRHDRAEPFVDGQPFRYDIVWVLKQETSGWRVSRFIYTAA